MARAEQIVGADRSEVICGSGEVICSGSTQPLAVLATFPAVCCVLLDAFNALTYIKEVEPVIRHNGTAS